MKQIKKTKYLLIIAIVCAILLTGCGETKAQQDGWGTSFHGGDDALKIEFADNQPPATIKDQSIQPFSIRMLIENLGEYDIPANSAYVTLNGFSPSDWELGETSKTLAVLNGYKKQGTNTIPGGKQQIVFDNLRYSGNVQSGSFPFKFYASICFPYKTRAFTSVCINGDAMTSINSDSKICDVDGKRTASNSGGPISIQNVEQHPQTATSILIQFDIVHKPMSDESNLYRSGSINSNCKIHGVDPSNADALEYKDDVTYTVDTGLAGLNCESLGTNNNTVKLYDNTVTVTCVQNTTGQEEYEKPVTITLDYDYINRVSKTINIEHIQK